MRLDAMIAIVSCTMLATVGCRTETSGSAVKDDIVPSATDQAESAADPCRAPALQAAEAEYGNSPHQTRVTTVTQGRSYRVAVGIGNPEDGEHDYTVVFSGSCTQKPRVTEITNDNPGPGSTPDCQIAALDAAKAEYGNAPNRTKVKWVASGPEFHVAVGIGNPEDGEHDYDVAFAGTCSQKPKVTEIQAF